MNKNTNLTPSMLQYKEIKDNHKDYILFFRMGDFYEMFGEDAKLASNLLGIVLTKKRGSKKNLEGESEDIPMCGVPIHSYETYLARLIKRGYKVAICDQLETPEEAKKRGYKAIVKRDVVRIVTPGTLVENNLLENDNYNFLLAINKISKNYNVAWLDISTGDFFLQEVGKESINSLLYKISPKEILLSETLDRSIIAEEFHSLISPLEDKYFKRKASLEVLNQVFVSKEFLLETISLEEKIICSVILNYLLLTHKNIPNVGFPKHNYDSSILKMDLFTIKSLELIKSYSGKAEGSLRKAIDKTATSQGSRLLSSWIIAPLVSLEKIKERHDVVEFFLKNNSLTKEIIQVLKSIPDIERAIGRIAFKKSSVYDLILIRSALKQISILKNILFGKDIPYLLEIILSSLDFYNNLLDILETSLMDDIAINHKGGDFIKKKFNPALDASNKKKLAILEEISRLQQRYVLKTGISNLKITYNSVAGYFIEVPSKQSKNISAGQGFQHKSTTLSSVRYTTEELIELEGRLSIILTQIKTLESEILENLFQEVLLLKGALQEAAKNIAVIDLLSSFAIVAVDLNLVRPKLTQEVDFQIEEGRHIVVESSLKRSKKGDFVPNNCKMDKENIFLITGPNMSGKSTFLRQNALMIILAQMGCFVPAFNATIGICDAVFSRVGASDDLFKGQSTFMVEMLELAAILNNATEKSFLILDEIGRGTSTYDGISIAWATLEYLNNKIRARSLFATHYHELVKLKDILDKVDCYYVKVEEHKNEIIFMHSLEKGVVTKSYGIDVAKIARLPSSVISRSKEILKTLEKEEDLPLFNFQELSFNNVNDGIVSLEEDTKNEESKLAYNILNEVQNIDENDISAKEALDIIFKLKEKINKNEY